MPREMLYDHIYLRPVSESWSSSLAARSHGGGACACTLTFRARHASQREGIAVLSWCAGGQVTATVALRLEVSERPCRTSGHLQVWDQMTKEHGRQHDRAIQLLPDMGREHLALTGLQRGRTE